MPYNNTYRHLYFDNFFTSTDLLWDLLKCGLYGCGTIQTHRRGFFKLLSKKGLGERGRNTTYQSGNLTVTLWQDNKPVTIAANNSDPTVCTSVFRKNRDGSRAEIPCTQSVASYNQFMGGVDRNDQLRGYYSVRMKCRKVYKYLFWFLLDVSITNSYILYKCSSSEEHKTSDLKTFRVDLAKSLIADYCSRKRLGHPLVCQPKGSSRHISLREVQKREGAVTSAIIISMKDMKLYGTAKIAVSFSAIMAGRMTVSCCTTPTM